MKKLLSIVLAMIILMGTLGCKAQESDIEPKPTTAPTATPEPTPEPTPETIDASETTGLEKSDDYVYNPIAVMIENSDGARPQTGLNQADIVYEALAESNITRFMCIYNDEYPVEVGPVRSTRLYYISEARDWDAALVHVGGPSNSSKPSYVYGADTSDIKVRIDGIKGKYASYVWRSSDRKAPHNCYTSVKKVFEEAVDYTPDERENWIFNTSEIAKDVMYCDSPSFSEVNIPFIGKSDFITYKYDKETNKLYRYMNGKEFMTYTVTEDSSGTKNKVSEQVCVQNLIVQYANCYELSGDVKGRRGYDLIGKGDAAYFVNGKYIEGYWIRESEDSSTVYYTSEGERLELMPGNTWIELHPKSKSITLEVSY